jgi:hypothetical protein
MYWDEVLPHSTRACRDVEVAPLPAEQMRQEIGPHDALPRAACPSLGENAAAMARKFCKPSTRRQFHCDGEWSCSYTHGDDMQESVQLEKK